MSKIHKRRSMESLTSVCVITKTEEEGDEGREYKDDEKHVKTEVYDYDGGESMTEVTQEETMTYDKRETRERCQNL